MREPRKIKIKQPTPNWQEGYISRKLDFNTKNLRLDKTSKWHMKHKPYKCDYDHELIRR